MSTETDQLIGLKPMPSATPQPLAPPDMSWNSYKETRAARIARLEREGLLPVADAAPSNLEEWLAQVTNERVLAKLREIPVIASTYEELTHKQNALRRFREEYKEAPNIFATEVDRAPVLKLFGHTLLRWLAREAPAKEQRTEYAYLLYGEANDISSFYEKTINAIRALGIDLAICTPTQFAVALVTVCFTQRGEEAPPWAWYNYVPPNLSPPNSHLMEALGITDPTMLTRDNLLEKILELSTQVGGWARLEEGFINARSPDTPNDYLIAADQREQLRQELNKLKEAREFLLEAKGAAALIQQQPNDITDNDDYRNLRDNAIREASALGDAIDFPEALETTKNRLRDNGFFKISPEQDTFAIAFANLVQARATAANLDFPAFTDRPAAAANFAYDVFKATESAGDDANSFKIKLFNAILKHLGRPNALSDFIKADLPHGLDDTQRINLAHILGGVTAAQLKTIREEELQNLLLTCSGASRTSLDNFFNNLPETANEIKCLYQFLTTKLNTPTADTPQFHHICKLGVALSKTPAQTPIAGTQVFADKSAFLQCEEAMKKRQEEIKKQGLHGDLLHRNEANTHKYTQEQTELLRRFPGGFPETSEGDMAKQRYEHLEKIIRNLQANAAIYRHLNQGGELVDTWHSPRRFESWAGWNLFIQNLDFPLSGPVKNITTAQKKKGKEAIRAYTASTTVVNGKGLRGRLVETTQMIIEGKPVNRKTNVHIGGPDFFNTDLADIFGIERRKKEPMKFVKVDGVLRLQACDDTDPEHILVTETDNRAFDTVAEIEDLLDSTEISLTLHENGISWNMKNPALWDVATYKNGLSDIMRHNPFDLIWALPVSLLVGTVALVGTLSTMMLDLLMFIGYMGRGLFNKLQGNEMQAGELFTKALNPTSYFTPMSLPNLIKTATNPIFNSPFSVAEKRLEHDLHRIKWRELIAKYSNGVFAMDPEAEKLKQFAEKDPNAQAIYSKFWGKKDSAGKVIELSEFDKEIELLKTQAQKFEPTLTDEHAERVAIRTLYERAGGNIDKLDAEIHFADEQRLSQVESDLVKDAGPITFIAPGRTR